jgi:hypothetical protein
MKKNKKLITIIVIIAIIALIYYFYSKKSTVNSITQPEGSTSNDPTLPIITSTKNNSVVSQPVTTGQVASNPISTNQPSGGTLAEEYNNNEMKIVYMDGRPVSVPKSLVI